MQADGAEQNAGMTFAMGLLEIVPLLAGRDVERALHRTIDKRSTKMRKFTASVLATAVLAGGVLSGAALAAPSPSHQFADRATSIDRSSSTQRDSGKARSRHESSSRDRVSHLRHLDGTRDR